jgi:hypothetical protein
MKQIRFGVMVAALCVLVVCQTVALAQNLGAAPQTNVAVQGQTGAQPEGAFLNFVNWVGNVIAPVGAGVAVVGGHCVVCKWARLSQMGRNGRRSACGIRSHQTPGVLDPKRHGRRFVTNNRLADCGRYTTQGCSPATAGHPRGRSG